MRRLYTLDEAGPVSSQIKRENPPSPLLSTFQSKSLLPLKISPTQFLAHPSSLA
jgi:hypothetical protein